jgi:hypothetical protein
MKTNTTLVLLAALSLQGCAALDKALENRVLCTAAGDEVHAISKWGRFSIGTEIAKADVAAIVEACRNAAKPKG